MNFIAQNNLENILDDLTYHKNEKVHKKAILTQH